MIRVLYFVSFSYIIYFKYCDTWVAHTIAVQAVP